MPLMGFILFEFDDVGEKTFLEKFSHQHPSFKTFINIIKQAMT